MGNGPVQPPTLAQPQGQPGGAPQGPQNPGSQGPMPQGTPGAPPQGGPAAPLAQPDPDMTPIPGTPGQQQPDQKEQIKNMIDSLMQENNLAKKVQKKVNKKTGRKILDEMAEEIVMGIENDERSREGWLKNNQEWLNLALLVRENKVYPWPKAANIKYPLLATAAMQFSARAYPALVPADGHIVKTKVVQMNAQDPIYDAAERVSQHMSYQVMECLPDWEQDMDKLLITMAVSGICFKKTYHDAQLGCHRSNLVYPENLIINYHAKSLLKAYRKTELLKYTDNEIEEKIRNNEEFLDIKYGPVQQPNQRSVDKAGDKATGQHEPSQIDKATPHEFYSCHTFWDLDEDGYAEPYIVTIHKPSKQIARIIARWCMDDVKYTDDGKKVAKITPLEYFTAFPFIPNPDGSIYALGFGLLLGPLNESANSIINMLHDAGHLANMPAGFIGKGLRLRMGQTSLQPGEFKVVNATGDDLQKSVYVMPFKEPSNVLFQLLQMLIQSGNQLASIAEIFVGKMPGQNTPATTTQDTIQQGMAVFTAIYKRVYRSLAEEFKKLFWLNKINPDIVDEESKIAGMALQSSDYNLPDWVVIPGADPSGDTGSLKVTKLQSLQPFLQMGTIDPMIFTKRFIDANEIPNGQELMRQPQPQPEDPKVTTEKLKQQGMQQDFQQDQERHQMDMQAGAAEVSNKQQLATIAAQQKSLELQHTQQKQAMELQGDRHNKLMDTVKTVTEHHHKIQKDLVEGMATLAKHVQALGQAHQVHSQKMTHTEQQHRQTLTMKAQQARQQAKQKSSSGNSK